MAASGTAVPPSIICTGRAHAVMCCAISSAASAVPETSPGRSNEELQYRWIVFRSVARRRPPFSRNAWSAE